MTGSRSILEVGSGVGELGLLLTERGIGYVGVEPDASRAASCQDAGLDVRTTPLELLPADLKFDLVVIDNVLEHVIDPVGLLNTAQAFLGDGGRLVVVVPNRKDIRSHVPSWSRKHLWTPRVHVNYFTGATLKDALVRSGLEPEHVPGATFAGTGSLSRRLVGYLNGAGIYPFGIYMAAKLNRPGSDEDSFS
ncbi:MAG: class I SAM-dependent methyltransferase [Chloroflexi bacterium]|nr:class I SAM-dependent methyltransferase [Chloroflexota bacterium]